MKYIGNINDIIDWDSVIREIKERPANHTGPDNSLADHSGIVGFQEILDKWNSVGVKTVKEGGTNNWDMYLLDFNKYVVDTFSDYVNADVMFAWIANIHPGNMAHWHWDTSSKEDMFDAIPNIVRYCCFVTDYVPGHVFMTANHAFSNYHKGDVWQWPDRKLWHGGVNFGLEEKYMMHFIGVTRK